MEPLILLTIFITSVLVFAHTGRWEAGVWFMVLGVSVAVGVVGLIN